MSRNFTSTKELPDIDTDDYFDLQHESSGSNMGINPIENSNGKGKELGYTPFNSQTCLTLNFNNTSVNGHISSATVNNESTRPRTPITPIGQMTTNLNSNYRGIYTNRNNSTVSTFNLSEDETMGDSSPIQTSFRSTIYTSNSIINSGSSNDVSSSVKLAKPPTLIQFTSSFDSLLLSMYYSHTSNPTLTPFTGRIPPAGVVGRVAKDAMKRASKEGISIRKKGESEENTKINSLNKYAILASVRRRLRELCYDEEVARQHQINGAHENSNSNTRTNNNSNPNINRRDSTTSNQQPAFLNAEQRQLSWLRFGRFPKRLRKYSSNRNLPPLTSASEDSGLFPFHPVINRLNQITSTMSNSWNNVSYNATITFGGLASPGSPGIMLPYGNSRTNGLEQSTFPNQTTAQSPLRHSFSKNDNGYNNSSQYQSVQQIRNWNENVAATNNEDVEMMDAEEYFTFEHRPIPRSSMQNEGLYSPYVFGAPVHGQISSNLETSPSTSSAIAIENPRTSTTRSNNTTMVLNSEMERVYNEEDPLFRGDITSQRKRDSLRTKRNPSST